VFTSGCRNESPAGHATVADACRRDDLKDAICWIMNG
jgi:hypothetical protein